ncbi:hypothetical protein [Ideonella paludis]|uniref:Uncharacterized protein n=1 Tax=Ideonella paludis TaxID=1233411 RepID=A0ABS5DVC9_9BURK|nr:hypothetical protein [Ideonella paludis]MBQ0935108.1 hypothetical protein [Ideonella paludis]
MADFTQLWQPASEVGLTALLQQACQEQGVVLAQLSFAPTGSVAPAGAQGLEQPKQQLASLALQARFRGSYPATKRVLGMVFKAHPNAVLTLARWTAPQAGAGESELSVSMAVMQPPLQAGGTHAP